MRLVISCLCALLGLFGTVTARAVDEADLLPAEEAFVLQAEATARDRIELRWTIADGYYLYRHRFEVQSDDAMLRLPPLALPAGRRHRDEFFGEVETYRGTVVGRLDRVDTGGAGRVRLQVKYQGCAEAGFCYPPQTQRITVALPAANAAVGAASAATALKPSPSGGGLGGGGVAPIAAEAAPTQAVAGIARIDAASDQREPLFGVAAGAMDELPLPPEQAFRFEAIAASPIALLLRFTPASGYYLYRDRSAFRIMDGKDIDLGTPRWPRGRDHQDEHFGKVVVYFDQVEVPLPLRRKIGDAQTIALEATFQGCQTDGICYPPMTRRVQIPLPQASAAELVTSVQLVAHNPEASPSTATGETIAGTPGGHAAATFRGIDTVADLDRELAAAEAAGRAVLFDFYADWCAPCRQMDKRTFPAQQLRSALAQFVLLKADVTANDADDQALLRRYGIVGPPATLFFGADGQERRALRLRGFEPPEAFATRLAKAADATRR